MTYVYVQKIDFKNSQPTLSCILTKQYSCVNYFLAKLEDEREEERKEMERQFSERLQSVSDEFAQELYNNTEELELKHKKALGE